MIFNRVSLVARLLLQLMSSTYLANAVVGKHARAFRVMIHRVARQRWGVACIVNHHTDYYYCVSNHEVGLDFL